MKETATRIINILKEYSDENHTLTQTKIKEIYEREYGEDIDRKTIVRHLESMDDQGLPVVFGINKDDKEKKKITNIYWENEFTNGELRFLIDMVLFSKNIPMSFAKELTNKLKGFGNKYLRSSLSNVYNTSSMHYCESNDLFLNIEIISEAIDANKKITFKESEYDLSGKLNINNGKTLTVSPYKLVANNNAYYLIAKNAIGALVNYKVSKMSEIEINKNSREDLDVNFDVGTYIKAHPLMKNGEAERVKIRITKDIISDMFEAFGNGIKLTKEAGGHNSYIAEFKASSKDIVSWALMNGRSAEIIEPSEIRERMNLLTSRLSMIYDKEYQSPYEKALMHAEKRGFFRYSGDMTELDDRYKNLKNINYASFRYNGITDFSFIKNYYNLRSLIITNNILQDFSFLKDLKSLEILELFQVNLQNLDYIFKIPQLKSLTVLDCEITDYEIFNQLKNLEFLELDYEAAQKLDFKLLRENNPGIKIELTNIEEKLNKRTYLGNRKSQQ